jgi:drug/metabolite transporter (DMT)-like permease
MGARGRNTLAICVAACCFGVVTVLAKLAYRAGSAPASLLTTRLTVAALVLCAVAFPARSPPLAAGAAGGACFATGGFLEFEALERLPAPALAVLMFLAPIWVAVGSRIAWGRRLGRLELLMVVLALGGIVMLVGSPAGKPLDRTGIALAVAASALYAGTFLVVEALVVRHEADVAIASLVGGAAAAALAVQPGGPVRELAEPETAAYAAAVGVVTAASLFLLARGLRTSTAFMASLATGAEPVVVALLSWIVLGELLTALQVLGGAAVVAAVTCVSIAAGCGPTAHPTAAPARSSARRRSRGGTGRRRR